LAQAEQVVLQALEAILVQIQFSKQLLAQAVAAVESVRQILFKQV
jgi:hypothetical protein